MKDPLPRKLAAILYADVAGYSRLTGEDEEGTHRRLSEYPDVIRDAIEEHQGRVVHYAGDAVLADFGTVTEALACSTSIQRELANRNQDLPDERKLQFRIGVNLDEVIVDRDDIYADGVNVAARLESLAEPGGICISDAVRTAIGQKLGFHFEDMGAQEVKNIAELVRSYLVRFRPEDARAPQTVRHLLRRARRGGRGTESRSVTPRDGCAALNTDGALRQAEIGQPRSASVPEKWGPECPPSPRLSGRRFLSQLGNRFLSNSLKHRQLPFQHRIVESEFGDAQANQLPSHIGEHFCRFVVRDSSTARS